MQSMVSKNTQVRTSNGTYWSATKILSKPNQVNYLCYTHIETNLHVEGLLHHDWVPACELMPVIRDVTHSRWCGVGIQWRMEKGQDTVRRYSCTAPSSRVFGTYRSSVRRPPGCRATLETRIPPHMASLLMYVNCRSSSKKNPETYHFPKLACSSLEYGSLKPVKGIQRDV